LFNDVASNAQLDFFMEHRASFDRFNHQVRLPTA
jgi:hypothetical protein